MDSCSRARKRMTMTKPLCSGLLGFLLVSAAGCTDLGTNAGDSAPESADAIKVSDGTSSGTVGAKVEGDSLAAASYAAICAVHDVPPILATHPPGVVTWQLRGGTVLQKDDFCQIGKVLLWMQQDGNLVIYDENGGARWASNTFGTGHHTNFQPDGNFVVYNSANQPLRTGPVRSEEHTSELQSRVDISY